MNIYYDKDADLSIIKGMTVAIIGYGSQGHAHANNLKDSGVNVVVGLRASSSSVAKAQEAGLAVKEVPEAVASADMVMLLTPDEFQSELYKTEIEPNLKQGATLAFAHGFAIHYNQVVPRADLDVVMIIIDGAFSGIVQNWLMNMAGYDLYKQAPALVDNVLRMFMPDENITKLIHQTNELSVM